MLNLLWHECQPPGSKQSNQIVHHLETRLDPSRQGDQGDPDEDIREAGEPHYFHNCNNDLLPVCRPRGTSLQVCLQKKRGHCLPESWRRNLSIQSRYKYPYLRRLMPVIIVTLSQFLIFFHTGCVASAQSRVKWQTSVCASSFVHGQPQVSSLFDIEQGILSYNHYHYHLFCMVNAK